MKTGEGKLGRVFLIRLEEGDEPKESIERFVAEKAIHAAQVFLVGDNAVTGIIAPDASGTPVLKLPSGTAVSDADWINGELVVQEVVGIDFHRVVDPKSGRTTLARVVSTKTRVMEKAAPVPDDSGPGTIPVYLFNAEFN